MLQPQRQQLYVIPRSQRDITRFVWVAFLIFGFVTTLTFILVTQYAAWQFRFHPALGSPAIVLDRTRLYWPWSILIWIFRYFRPDSSPEVLSVIKTAQLLLAAGALGAIIFPVAYVFRRTRKLQGERNDLHGSAHWADAEEIEAAGILPTQANIGGVMLGAVDVPVKRSSLNPFRSRTKTVYLRHAGPEHILVFAPTRSGKGVGIVIPTLLSWSESVLVHDIKGENWALTSGFRERVLKQRCLRFSPSEMASARFNPLSEIRLDENLVKDVQNVSTMIVDPDGKGLQDHWAKTGFDLMTGVIIFVLVSDELDGSQRNLSTVQAILSDGGPVRELAERLAADKDSIVVLCAPIPHASVGHGPCPDGSMPLLKRVVAVEGDEVRATDDGVEVNGRTVPNSKPFNLASNGGPLPHLRGTFDLKPGEIWVAGEHPNSFDSRYFGPVRIPARSTPNLLTIFGQ